MKKDDLKIETKRMFKLENNSQDQILKFLYIEFSFFCSFEFPI